MGLASDVHLHEADVPDVKTLHHTRRELTLTVLVLQSVCTFTHRPQSHQLPKDSSVQAQGRAVLGLANLAGCQ